MADGIDHLVIAVPDLDAASDELEASVGLRCTGGGHHEGLGTANRLAFLADGSYIELMAVEDEEEARGWAVGIAVLRQLERGPGLAAYAVLDEALPVTVARLRSTGSHIGLPIAGSRRRPDGELVRWWTAVAEPMGPDGLPFLIRHARSGAEWGPAAMAARADIAHPAGSPVRLVGLDLAVADPLDLAALHRAQLGLEYSLVGTAVFYPAGRHVIRLLPMPTAGERITSVRVRLRATGAARETSALGASWVASP